MNQTIKSIRHDVMRSLKHNNKKRFVHSPGAKVSWLYAEWLVKTPNKNTVTQNEYFLWKEKEKKTLVLLYLLSLVQQNSLPY